MNELVSKGLACVKSAASTGALKVKKYSPEICLAIGLIAGAAAIVSAIKETGTVDETLDEFAKNKTQIEEETTEDKSEHNKQITKLYLHTGVNMAKNYKKTIGFSAISLASLLYSYGVLKKREVAITAAYGCLDSAFKRYRKNVIERYGQEVDEDMKLGRTREIIEVEETDEKGKKKKVKKEISKFKDPSEYSDFARFFDETNPLWTKNPEYNLMFLKAQQEQATRLLRAKKHLFLNDVYEMIGIDPTPEGQAVGWLYNGPNSDNFVDFGIYDDNQQCIDFVNCRTDSILLDFNVDGVIWKDI